MSSLDRGVDFLSFFTIPLDHHGRLGPHRAAPDVGKSRQRRPSGAWLDRWPVETDNLSGSSTRAHRPRHGRPGAQKSPAHVPRGYPSRFGDGKVLGWYLVRLCVQIGAPPEAQAEALGRPAIELSCRPVGAARLFWPSHSCTIHVWCMCHRGVLEICAERSVIYSRGVQMSATDTVEGGAL